LITIKYVYQIKAIIATTTTTTTINIFKGLRMKIRRRKIILKLSFFYFN